MTRLPFLPGYGAAGRAWRRRTTSLAAASAFLVLGIGVLAGVNLYLLHASYQEAVHALATRSVLGIGERVVRQLLDQPAVQRADAGDKDWREFARTVHTLRGMEDGLEYVSITERGVILYQEPLGGAAGEADRGPGEAAAAPVQLGRQLLVHGDRAVPVITFTAQTVDARGTPRSLQVAIRKETVEREEAPPHSALTAMFRVALLTITLSFGLCVALIGWLLRREFRREEHRRQEEHLAFAGAVANGILHDFRNPMSALRLDVQLLQKEAGRGAACRGDKLTELAGRAQGTVERLEEILGEFQTLSRPDAGPRGVIELNACVRDCVALLASRFHRAGVRAESELAQEALHVRGYPTGLRRALVNILTNAEQASPREGRVAVRTRREAGEAVVEIADQGPGVPAAERERIFEMFVSHRPGGMGLGLALARTVAESMGGSIGVEDAPGGGALFVVRLPLADEG